MKSDVRLAEAYDCQSLECDQAMDSVALCFFLVLGKPCTEVTEVCLGRAAGWHDRFLDDGPLQCLPCNFRTAGEWRGSKLLPCSLLSLLREVLLPPDSCLSWVALPLHAVKAAKAPSSSLHQQLLQSLLRAGNICLRQAGCSLLCRPVSNMCPL